MKKISKHFKALIDSQGHSYQFGKVIDRIVNLCTYAVILSLVGYMIARILKSFIVVFQVIGHGFSQDGVGGFIAPEEAIHTVPITIILVKAYKLLLEYAKTQHVNIKYVLEIAITAPVVEIIFNFTGYDMPQLIFMGAFMIIVTIIYLFFYPRIKEGEIDYSREHKH